MIMSCCHCQAESPALQRAVNDNMFSQSSSSDAELTFTIDVREQLLFELAVGRELAGEDD